MRSNVVEDAGVYHHYVRFEVVSTGWPSGLEWTIYGDRPGAGEPADAQGLDCGGQTLHTPLEEFVTELSCSSGGHNGPTLYGPTGVLDPIWYPDAIGDQLCIHMSFTTDVDPTKLYWSTLTGPGPHANFEPVINDPTLGEFHDDDGNGILSGCDTCVDTDEDGVCDPDDQCEGFDDAVDTDGDGVADGCDPCPSDNPDDSDEDGVCDSDDACVGDDATGDVDLDGFCADSDCNDDDAEVNPLADEVCDGVDTNCDGVLPDDESDGDEDGVSECDGDCDDGALTIHPGADEVCNGFDDNCDGTADEGDVCEEPERVSEQVGGCGCTSAPTSPAWLGLIGLLALVARRR